MIGAICAAATTGAYVMDNHTLLGGTGQNKGGIINSGISSRQAQAIQIPNQLPKITNVLGPHDRMHTQGGREDVITLAGQAYATSGNTFWAKRFIQEEQEDSTPNWAMAL